MEQYLVVALLIAVFGLRAWKADQPIVENYVGRQIPTAMVARNLDRGGSWLRPELDTGPFPNLFLIEPPVFATCAVAVHRATTLGLEAAGRCVSAFGMTLAAWGLYGLIRVREGPRIALLGAVAFAVFPVTIRYGRAFQGDALMLGCAVAGLRCWDSFRERGDAVWLIPAWTLIALGLMLKLTSAYFLVPLGFLLSQGAATRRRWGLVLLAGSALIPAALWYVHAAAVVRGGTGSLAASDNFAIWSRVLLASGLASAETYKVAARFFLLRAFTPVAIVLAAWGLIGVKRIDRFWVVWLAAAALALLVLAAKLHHEYYWLALAPIVAVGVGRALGNLCERGRFGRRIAWAAGITLIGLAVLQSASTWRTPGEWGRLNEASAAVRDHVPPGSLVVAPEALLYTANRKGCRLEYVPAAAQRAAGEWGEARRLDGRDPGGLLEFYRAHGAAFVADLGRFEGDDHRQALHEAIRRRYRVLVDNADVLLAELKDSGEFVYVVR